MRFARIREESWVRVQYEGTAPRERVTGLIVGIREVLSQAATFNSWFQPHSFVTAFLGVIGMFGFLLTAVAFFSEKPTPYIVRWSFLFIGVVLSGYVLIGFSTLGERKYFVLERAPT